MFHLCKTSEVITLTAVFLQASQTRNQEHVSLQRITVLERYKFWDDIKYVTTFHCFMSLPLVFLFQLVMYFIGNNLQYSSYSFLLRILKSLDRNTK
jgi:hypothetical protein